MKSAGSGGGDIFDLFDLDNDNDIDFETAYRMISNFDDVALNDGQDELFSRLGLGDLTEVEAQFGLNSNSKEDQYEQIGKQQQQQQQQQQQHDQWHEQWALQLQSQPSRIRPPQYSQDISAKQQLQQQHHLNSPDQNAEAATGGDYIQSDAYTKDGRSQLLSACESNAIEHFLDSLISQNHEIEKEEQESLKKDSPRIDSADIASANVPPAVEIPEITIADSDIPMEIKNDASKVKKWKHVEIERIRRNQIKKAFDQLIYMTRYSRGSGKNKIAKPSNDKRVPKHTLLGYVVEDIKSILQANEKLEGLLRDITNIGKGDVGS